MTSSTREAVTSALDDPRASAALTAVAGVLVAVANLQAYEALSGGSLSVFGWVVVVAGAGMTVFGTLGALYPDRFGNDDVDPRVSAILLFGSVVMLVVIVT